MQVQDVLREGAQHAQPELLSVPDHGDQSRQVNPQEDVPDNVKLFVVVNYRIFEEVTVVDCLSLQEDVRMLLREEPAHVSEERPSPRVVRISVRFCVFVMQSVISAPGPDVILSSSRE